MFKIHYTSPTEIQRDGLGFRLKSNKNVAIKAGGVAQIPTGVRLSPARGYGLLAIGDDELLLTDNVVVQTKMLLERRDEVVLLARNLNNKRFTVLKGKTVCRIIPIAVDYCNLVRGEE